MLHTFYCVYSNKNILKSIFHRTALHDAINCNNIDIIKLLLSHKDIDVNCKLIKKMFFK